MLMSVMSCMRGKLSKYLHQILFYCCIILYPYFFGIYHIVIIAILFNKHVHSFYVALSCLTHSLFSSYICLYVSRYDPLSSCLVDYQTRANMASVKNFQVRAYVRLGISQVTLPHMYTCMVCCVYIFFYNASTIFIRILYLFVYTHIPYTHIQYKLLPSYTYSYTPLYTVLILQLVRSGAARERGDEYADKAEDFIVQMGKVRVRV